MGTLKVLTSLFKPSTDSVMVKCIQVFRNDGLGFIVMLADGPVMVATIEDAALLIDAEA